MAEIQPFMLKLPHTKDKRGIMTDQRMFDIFYFLFFLSVSSWFEPDERWHRLLWPPHWHWLFWWL